MNAVYAKQIEWIKAMQAAAPDWLKSFLASCNILDSLTFYGLIIIIVWMGFSRLRGITLLYLFLMSAIVNLIVKHFYDMPRPFHLDISVRLGLAPGFGFPSGAAQTAMLFGGYIYYHVRKNWMLVLAIFYIAFMSFVRVFIGAHFIVDILMGWFVGGSLLTLYILFWEKLRKTFCRQSSLWRSLVLSLMVIWPSVVFCSHSTIRLAVAGVAFAIGIYLEEIYCSPRKDPKKITKKVWASISAIAQFFIVLFMARQLTLCAGVPTNLAISAAIVFLGFWIPMNRIFASFRI